MMLDLKHLDVPMSDAVEPVTKEVNHKRRHFIELGRSERRGLKHPHPLPLFWWASVDCHAKPDVVYHSGAGAMRR